MLQKQKNISIIKINVTLRCQISQQSMQIPLMLKRTQCLCANQLSQVRSTQIHDIWILDTVIICMEKGSLSHVQMNLYIEKSILKINPKISIMGKGDISIQSKDNTNVTIFYAYFVSRLFQNLLSWLAFSFFFF